MDRCPSVLCASFASGGQAGRLDQYVRLVESSYDRGKTKKSRTIANLGRRELLAPYVDRLVELLTGEAEPRRRRSWKPESAALWGAGTGGQGFVGRS
jgi:hypothetical protein